MAQYDNITVEEYMALTVAQKKLVKKDKVQSMLDDQLQERNLNDANLKRLITDTITKSIEAVKKDLKEELGAEINELREQIDKAEQEIKSFKKVITEQQKFMESSKRDKMRNKVFMAGIPNELNIKDDDDNEVTLNEQTDIILHILSYVEPNINQTKYKIIRKIRPKEGFTRHSCLLEFNDSAVKDSLVKKSKMLKDLDENNTLKKVYIKNEQTPLTRKENTRLYGEFQKLLEAHRGDRNNRVRLDKGKLTLNDNIVDEFNLANQIFH